MYPIELIEEANKQKIMHNMESEAVHMYSHLMKCIAKPVSTKWIATIYRGCASLNEDKIAFSQIADNNTIFERIKRLAIKEYVNDGNSEEEKYWIIACGAFPNLRALQIWENIRSYLYNKVLNEKPDPNIKDKNILKEISINRQDALNALTGKYAALK